MARSRIRSYAAGDAEQLAALVQRCLVEVNSRDYPADVIAGLCASYTAAQFAGLARRRHIYIADCGAMMAGTVSRERNKVFTMFVDPRWAARGIGRQLMRHAEQQAAGEGHDHMETAASITAHAFYLALGYTDLRESETGFGLTYLMRKPLPSPHAHLPSPPRPASAAPPPRLRPAPRFPPPYGAVPGPAGTGAGTRPRAGPRPARRPGRPGRHRRLPRPARRRGRALAGRPRAAPAPARRKPHQEQRRPSLEAPVRGHRGRRRLPPAAGPDLDTLGQILGADRTTISAAARLVIPLLEEHGITARASAPRIPASRLANSPPPAASPSPA